MRSLVFLAVGRGTYPIPNLCRQFDGLLGLLQAKIRQIGRIACLHSVYSEHRYVTE